MVICLAVRYWSAERERERDRNVMALEARWNLVLKVRLLVDNGL